MGVVKIKIRIWIVFSGTLTLVDLAGSERLDDSANTSTNNETKKINLSLLELTKVLRSLRKKVYIIHSKTQKILKMLMSEYQNNQFFKYIYVCTYVHF